MEQLNLNVDDPLIIEFPHIKPGQRYRCKLLGYNIGQSIMITSPRDGSDAPLLRENDLCTVRYMDGINACAFKSRVRRNCIEPYPYVHLYFPHSIEAVQLRQAQRFSVKFDANVHAAGGESVPVCVSDICTQGVGFFAPRAIAEPGESIVIDIDLGDDSSRIISLRAEICNAKQARSEGGDDHGYRYGAKLLMADADSQLKISELIFRHLNIIRSS